MRLLLALVLVSACGSKPAPDRAPKPDPWAGSGSDSGTAPKVDIPAWANDPPDVLRDKITGVNAHVIVLKSSGSFVEYREIVTAAEKTPGVVAVEPFIFLEVQIASAKHTAPDSVLKAVDPKRVERVLALPKTMKVGTVATLASGEPPPIILGDDLAKKLAVKIGDEITISPLANADDKFGPKKFQLAGTFHVEFDEYDERLGYASLAAVQAMLGKGDQVLGVELVVDNLDNSETIARTLETAIGGPPYLVQDWYELNKALFTELYGERRP